MALEDIAGHSYFVLARKSPKEDYVFAVYINHYKLFLAHLPPPMTKEESAKAIALLREEGYKTMLVPYNPDAPGGIINLGTLTVNKIIPELIELGKKFTKASEKPIPKKQ